jgi:hypothetical protein
MLIYRWDIQRWSPGALTLQWISRAPVPVVASGSPLVAGQLQLAAIVGDPNASNAPILTESLLDLETESGLLLLTEVSGAGYLAYFTGSPLPAQIGTKVVEITENARTYVGDDVRPMLNSAQSGLTILTETGNQIILQENGFPILTELSAAVFTVAVSARDNYYDPEIFGPEVSPDVMGNCPQRADGRYHRARITVSSGVWSTAFGVDAEGIEAGQR